MDKIRMKNLEKIMTSRKLDAIILTTFSDVTFNENIYYYTGFKGYGMLLCTRKSKTNSLKATLAVSAIEFEKAKKTGANVALIKKEKRKEILQKIIGNAKQIGVDKNSITLSQFEELKNITVKTKSKSKVKFFDVGKDLLNARAIKTQEEISSMKEACEVCDKIFSEIIKNFKFKTEKELADFVVRKIREKGLETSFNPIVSSGKNSSDVHHNPSGKIEKGFLILDFGCKVNGYCSDMTRTIFVGKPTAREIKLYNELLEVQEKTLNEVALEKKCKLLDNFARDKLGERFLHNLGHGVGLEIHEKPNLSKLSEDILKENMIITIEPGIYEEGKYGVRIEDTVLVTKKGPVRLTKSKKELICVRNK